MQTFDTPQVGECVADPEHNVFRVTEVARYATAPEFKPMGPVAAVTVVKYTPS